MFRDSLKGRGLGIGLRKDYVVGCLRFAAFVVGDVNVFFPGLVCLRSVRKNNPHLDVDLFMSFDEADLTSMHCAAFDEFGINFVPAGDLTEFGSIDNMTEMSEGRWPQAVFLNWLMPLWLASRGYAFAAKLDYDVLCVAPWGRTDISNFSEVFSACVFEVDFDRLGVPQEVAAAWGIVDSKSRRCVPYFNVGVAFVNLDAYSSRGVFEDIKRAYIELIDADPSVPNAEQAAVALVCFGVPRMLRKIDESYNARSTLLPRLDKTGMPLVKNVHYVTHNKPWLSANFDYLDRYVTAKRTCVYMWRDLWLREAGTLSNYAGSLEIVVPSPLETIGVLTRVFDAHYRGGR